MIEPLLMTSARVSTFERQHLLTNASGFFFQRDQRLYLVTSRHVLVDEPSQHFPDRVEIELHTDPDNLTQSTGFSMLLYRNGRAVWRQGTDRAGAIDVAVIELDRAALPKPTALVAFAPEHLQVPAGGARVGSSLLIVGFPLGFHDALHHLPVARQAIIASPFGLRFQGKGYFLTDARMHRGSSGAPVVRSAPDEPAQAGGLPWILLGVHSAQFDVGTRDSRIDESLGLNCAWYADILMTLTEPAV